MAVKSQVNLFKVVQGQSNHDYIKSLYFIHSNQFTSFINTYFITRELKMQY